MTGKILIVEDNNEINQMLVDLLNKNGYITKSAFSGTEGMLYFSMENFDVILMDLMLPGMNGEEVIKKIRVKSNVPIIVISAKTDIDAKVELLENGADDYIIKPFDVREVLARIKLQMNKNNGHKENENQSIIVAGELEINDTAHIVKINGNEIILTRQEYNILYILYSNPGKIYTKQELYNLAWDEYYIGADKTLNVHVSNIRNKFKEYTDVNYIETVWGIGFKAGQVY